MTLFHERRLFRSSKPQEVPEGFRGFTNIASALAYLSETKRQSLLVEGGAATLNAFIDADLWDEIRVETAPFTIDEGVAGPTLPAHAKLVGTDLYDGRVIRHYAKRTAQDVKKP